jgi:hypothetical protein
LKVKAIYIEQKVSAVKGCEWRSKKGIMKSATSGGTVRRDKDLRLRHVCSTRKFRGASQDRIRNDEGNSPLWGKLSARWGQD